MGVMKEEWMRRQELQPMYDWIEDNYGDDAGEEGSEEWKEAVQAYEDDCERQRQRQEKEELEWYIYSQSQINIFTTQMDSITELLNVKVYCETRFNLHVMLHAHAIASVESYLASTFIHKVTNSEDLIRKLVESDPKFSKMKFTMKEIYEKQESLKLTVARYLKDLIFHDIEKVKPMFKNVLDCDFGDVGWLIKAVETRHHCVHRAGLDKDGESVEISIKTLENLVKQLTTLANLVEKNITQINTMKTN